MRIDEIFSRKARNALHKKRTGKTKTDDPYLLGDEARHHGKAESDNPYEEGTEDHADWAQGWREAEV